MPVAARAADGSDLPSPGRMVQLGGGAFAMGMSHPLGRPGHGEGPVHRVHLDPFAIQSTAVTNAAFAAFVEATGHRTTAERLGWSFVFVGLLPADFPPTRGVIHAPWWRQVFDADWRHPEGPQSDVGDRMDHPVVHVSWHDAALFCRWSGLRLPTEAEWEYAARGGLVQQAFPWGNERAPGGLHRMNIWQGRFPASNTMADGYLGTAPVDAYAPNQHGLHNMSGNVWEWCGDWFHPRAYWRGARRNPAGPAHGSVRVIRGGSYLCHAVHCHHFHVGARSHSSPNGTAGNIGFRCIWSPG